MKFIWDRLPDEALWSRIDSIYLLAVPIHLDGRFLLTSPLELKSNPAWKVAEEYNILALALPSRILTRTVCVHCANDKDIVALYGCIP